VAELYKARGREVEIGLEPGPYEVRVERGREAFLAKTRLSDGARVVLDETGFGATTLERTRSRGGDELPPLAVAGRNRLAMTTGVWGSHGGTVTVAGFRLDVFGGLQYTRYLREDLALTVGMTAFGAESQVDIIGGLAFPVGLRWNPRRGDQARQVVKPFVSAGLVPVTSADSEYHRPGRRATLGASLGGGVDVHVSPSFALGLNVGYNAIPDLGDPSGLHDNFGGLEVSLSVGLLFGSAR
jgi:hypothetical protein